MENVIYYVPNINELNDLCILNKYLFNLNIKEFDNTLNNNWTNEESYKDFFKKYFDTNNFYILFVKINSKLVGYIAGSIYESESYRENIKIAELENLMVLPGYQKKGVGHELSNRFKNWAKENKAQRLKVNVYSKNHDAYDFYKKLGFEDYDINLERDI